ncbi:MAG: hypothetical protein OdinLCB4_004900 [Candidatus Odinarchaeum yellowstonii]|uniref:Uncharacterized protein n=1 Tax=Odinarchaeota yellowstonii (strain LCB_4) TaxID=1841599 RepID=A0AAF0D1F3_ODILC|nr:MAG: hypothetical protein OdinLCB4_004900 [Candidatus Odinarchaeum yellowstonii]
MSNTEFELNNQINTLIQEFFKAVTINQANTALSRIKELLNTLKNYYVNQNRLDLAELTENRLLVWDAYQLYIDAKNYLIQARISDQRGQFTVGFSRSGLTVQSRISRYVISPKDVLNRIKLSNEFLKLIRDLREVPSKTYQAIKKTYALVNRVSGEETKSLIIRFLRNWTKLLLQWKIELLALGVITVILKGDPAEFKKLVEKHRELIAQLDALNQGQKYQKIMILDDATYQEIKNNLQSKYYDLTQRKGGLLGGGTRDILLFLNDAEKIQDITIPAFVFEIDFKELFPKELEANNPDSS